MNLLIVFPKMSMNLLDFLSETGASGAYRHVLELNSPAL